MKAYIRNNKIVFKVDEDPSKTINNILKILKELVRVCESRSISTFPVAEIKKLVDTCNSLIDKVEDINIPTNYVEYVNTNNESLGYFKQIEDKWKEAEANSSHKKNLFREFRENVKQYADII